MNINRTVDGSYGTVSFNYTDPYVLVFDPMQPSYSPGDQLGLVEVDSSDGWLDRTILVANTGPAPVEILVTWTSASRLLSSFFSVTLLLLI
jgi:hypothetical protein